jgi:hypothetical protein
LRGKMPMLVLHAHETDYSNSVAIVRLADVAGLGEEGAQPRVSEKVQIVTLLQGTYHMRGRIGIEIGNSGKILEVVWIGGSGKFIIDGLHKALDAKSAKNMGGSF